MKCYLCKSTRGGILHQTVPLGQVCENWICTDCLNGLPPKPIPANPNCKGETYKQRLQYQLDQWLAGNSVHNDVEEECTPDFSCCNADVKTSQAMREVFYYAPPSTQEKMLFQFLGGLVEKTTDKAFLADGSSEIIKDLN